MRKTARNNSLTVPNNNVESHKQGDKTNTRQPTLVLGVDRVRSTTHFNLQGMRDSGGNFTVPCISELPRPLETGPRFYHLVTSLLPVLLIPPFPTSSISPTP